jgi:hypothetical protein
VNHHAKAASAGSTQATGDSRGLFRRALATRGASGGSKGSGAPAAKLIGLLAISLIALFATAAPASAAPLAAKMGTVSNVSYASAHVTGEITSPGGGLSPTFYTFEYATSESGPWSPGPSGLVPGFAGAFENKPVEGEFEQSQGLKGGTNYFARLTVARNGVEAVSPEAAPYPSFTTLAVDPPTIPGAVEASPVFSTSAKVSAKVKRPANEDAAFDVNCHFEYITDAQYEENVNVNSAPGFEGATPIPCAENPVDKADLDAEPETKVTADLTGLSPATAYRLRLVAENAAPGAVTKEAAGTFTTEPPVAKPTVIATNAPTDLSYFSAKASGEVQRPAGDDPALDTSCRFEYVTDQQFNDNPPGEEFAGAGQAECVEAPSYAPLTGTDPTAVTADLSGLDDATTYHLRLTAANAGGETSKEAAATFTTLTAMEPTLEVTPVAPADVGYTTAHVAGTIDRGEPERSINYDFQIFTEPNPPENGSICCAQAPGKFNEYSRDFQNLKPGTTYYVRLSGGDVTNGYVERFLFSPQPLESFTTKGTSTPPIANLDPISLFTGASAHFSGTIDPKAPAEALPDEAKPAYKTDWHIECVPECRDANGNEIGGTVEAEEGAKAISGDAKRLEPNTAYEVKLIATNVLGTVESVQSFKTLKVPPAVKQSPGASDGKGGYTLQGVVNPNNETITGCEFKWGPNAPAYAFSAPCSPMPGGGSKPVTVEAHLTGLNPGVVYHALLVVTYDAGAKASGVDQEFTATLSPAESCPNEQIRKENNSLAMPECRAYEMVTPPGKEGWKAKFFDYSGGNSVLYISGSPNIAKSGQSLAENGYTTVRSPAGWETVPNLNGPSGYIKDAPSYVATYTGGLISSADLLSTIWNFERIGGPAEDIPYLRNPDGTFTQLGKGTIYASITAASDDLSHLLVTSNDVSEVAWGGGGVYEFVGTGDDPPRRVDVDNDGAPISSCGIKGGLGTTSALGNVISADGRTIAFEVGGGCGSPNPPANQVWARIDGTTSVDVSASHCNRVDCNAPADAIFRGAAKDGSRIFFTTTQQLVNADTDQTTDIYACDIPSGTPAPVGDANPCSAFRQVSSGAATGADVEGGYRVPGGFGRYPGVSDDGSAIVFSAKGVLSDNEDALGEQAVAGDHNLYVWRQDAAHPDGQTAFVGRLDSNDLTGGTNQTPQITPDGRYLVFTTANQLLDTDTDTARDVYRYDADTGDLTRASTNVFGVAGNGDGFDAAADLLTDHNSHATVSDDGQKIVFTTTEALSPADGNGQPDVYLWTPGRVSLITTGAVGGGGEGGGISGSGQDIYFATSGALTPADGDDLGDVYDARIGGGFSFTPRPICTGEGCQPDPTPAPPEKAPLSAQPGPGNPSQPKPCRKGKVRSKKGKCVKKPKKHSGKKHHAKKREHANSNSGGGK